MSIPRLQSRYPLLAMIGFGLIAGSSGLNGFGQEPRRSAKDSGPTRTLITPDACAQCHGAAARPPSVFGRKDAAQLVRLNEYPTWNDRDKHRRAYDALTGPRGRQIGLALGYTDVTREKACLSCHGTGFLPEDPPAESSGALEARSQGVGCTACHGPYLEWVQGHGLAGESIRKWRLLSSVEKARDYGMTDLRDPAIRAKVCLSCHLGNLDEGKIVSHAMYASGHPPLPGFEVASFGRAMPAHWWEPDEIPLFREDPAVRTRYGVDPSDFARTKAVLIGGVVAFRESMRLLAAEAERKVSGETKAAWPEFARFECYACHHDLKAPGYQRWRQVRGYGHEFDGLVMKGKAGHARLRPWPLALIEPALDQADRSTDARPVRESIREGVKALYSTMEDRPFGDPDDVVRSAKRLEAASQSLLDALNASRFDGSTPPRLIAALSLVPDKEFPDYDSARQIAWAIKSIHNDWRPKPANDDRIVSMIGELDRLLKLNPYASLEARAKLIADKGPAWDQLSDELLRQSEAEYRFSLSSAAHYDPVEFKKVMARLSKLLSGSELPPLPH